MVGLKRKMHRKYANFVRKKRKFDHSHNFNNSSVRPAENIVNNGIGYNSFDDLGANETFYSSLHDVDASKIICHSSLDDLGGFLGIQKEVVCESQRLLSTETASPQRQFDENTIRDDSGIIAVQHFYDDNCSEDNECTGVDNYKTWDGSANNLEDESYETYQKIVDMYGYDEENFDGSECDDFCGNCLNEKNYNFEDDEGVMDVNEENEELVTLIYQIKKFMPQAN